MNKKNYGEYRDINVLKVPEIESLYLDDMDTEILGLYQKIGDIMQPIWQ